MKIITIKQALKEIQDKKDFIIRCNKSSYEGLKCYEGQTCIKNNGKIGTIRIKNKIIVHPKLKYIYLYI